MIRTCGVAHPCSGLTTEYIRNGSAYTFSSAHSSFCISQNPSLGPSHCDIRGAEKRSIHRRKSAVTSAAAPKGGPGVEVDPVREWILGEGGASKISRISPVSGGCINMAHRYDTDVGPFFVKSNSDIGSEMFVAEMKGLQAMADAGAIRVPRPFKAGPLPRRGSFIIMEFVKFGAPKKGQVELGRQLALMHKQGTNDKGFGFDVDNTIGSTHQRNPWSTDWPTFFRDHRLGFQLNLIQQRYRDNALYEAGQSLLSLLPSLLPSSISPSLLHGDLWSGNIAADEEGNPLILDPATYYGHSEAEFGMAWCANFGPAFYDAYFEILPKQPGFEERVLLYKLYHYLNHYNLFGSGYRSSCTDIINRFV